MSTQSLVANYLQMANIVDFAAQNKDGKERTEVVFADSKNTIEKNIDNLPNSIISLCEENSVQTFISEGHEEYSESLPKWRDPVPKKLQDFSPRGTFIALQKWEGVVLEVKEDFFTAKLYSIKEERPEEIAEIPLEEIQENDLNLLTPGALFHWSIGLQKRNGQHMRGSQIVFRRLPAWRKKELQIATQKGEALFNALNSEKTKDAASA